MSLGTTGDWVDAFGMFLDARAAAAADPRVKAEVNDAIRATKAHAATIVNAPRLEQQQALRAAKNQEHIARQLEKFTAEQYGEVKSLWRRAKQTILSLSWDLTRDVFFDQLPSGSVQLHQAGEKAVVLPAAEASMVVAFLRFVEQFSPAAQDPRTITKRMLLAQGITAENFHEHAESLAIANPWDESLRFG